MLTVSRTFRTAPSMLLAVGAVTVLGLALRLVGIGDKSLWIDEAFSVWMSTRPLGELWLNTVQIDAHPPLYYALLHLWIGPDSGDASLRAFSALWGAATVPVVYLIGREVGGKSVGLLAAVLMAISPLHVAYGQQARMYTMLTFFAVVSMYCVIRLVATIGNPAQRHPLSPATAGLCWVGFAVATALAMLSHNTGVLLAATVAAFALALPALRRVGARQYPAPVADPAPSGPPTTGTTAPVATPGVATPANRVPDDPTADALTTVIEKVPVPSLDGPTDALRTAQAPTAAVPMHAQAVGPSSLGRTTPVGPTSAPPAAAQGRHRGTGEGAADGRSWVTGRYWTAAGIAILVLWLPWLPAFLAQSARIDAEFWISAPTPQTVLEHVRDLAVAHSWDVALIPVVVTTVALAALGAWRLRHRPELLVLLVLLVVGPLIAELLVSLRRPIFSTRTLIWTAVPLFVLVAAGVLQLRRRVLISAVVAAILAVHVGALAGYYRTPGAEDWRGAAAYLQARAQPGDVVLFSAGWTELPFTYYYERTGGPPVEGYGLPVDAFDRAELEPKMAPSDIPRLDQLTAGKPRVWLVLSHDWYTDPQRLVTGRLGQSMRVTEQQDLAAMRIQLYQPG